MWVDGGGLVVVGGGAGVVDGAGEEGLLGGGGVWDRVGRWHGLGLADGGCFGWSAGSNLGHLACFLTASV